MIKSRKMITIENSLNHFLKDSSNYITEAIPLDNAKLIPLESLDLDNRLSPDGSFLPAIVPIQELGKNLLKAASDGNIEEIKALMSRGAPFTADWLGACPLHYAATNNHSEACEVLLRAGVSRNSRTKVDRTPLHMASYEGHIDVVEVLLNHRADYDCQDMLQMTPLHWAAQNAHTDIVTALVRHGCNTTLTNKFQLTAADIARQMGRGDLVEVIEAAVRDPVDPTEATDQLAMELLEEEGVDDGGLLVEGGVGGGGEEDGDGDGDGDMLVESDGGGLKEELYDDGSVEYVDNGYGEVERRDEDIVTIENVEDEENETNPNLEEAPCENDNDHVENIVKNTNLSNYYTESMKILQEHGIEMLPPDEHNILSSAMETGHTVALTEAGKQALNAIKPAMPKEMFKHLVLPKKQIVATPQVKMKKIITLTAEEFLAMTTNGIITTSDGNVLKKLSLSNQQKNKLVTTKRIVMKKSKVSSISQTMHPNPMSNPNPIQFKKKIQMYSAADYEALQKKLREANQLVEIYKKKFLKKEEEAERFKHQLKLMLENST